LSVRRKRKKIVVCRRFRGIRTTSRTGRGKQSGKNAGWQKGEQRRFRTSENGIATSKTYNELLCCILHRNNSLLQVFCYPPPKKIIDVMRHLPSFF